VKPQQVIQSIKRLGL